MADGEVTQGGYSTYIVTQEKFVFSVAPSLHVPGAAPLLCAGITVYSPMRFYGADKKGMRVRLGVRCWLASVVLALVWSECAWCCLHAWAW